ncbi:hypothetical protein CR159_20280 [Pollutimonas subterranea]|uniref:TrfA protein n=1 Tax=Pollutimonas subterranea TaxID=2045210 RepID=A0A2N4TZ31_9BURK|nr:plasmid replication initiator TrfA [Pollutimonas subterranea]PLC48026.1 hypothetical protein CR159_20280 [Pollutimonas subterranea]
MLDLRSQAAATRRAADRVGGLTHHLTLAAAATLESVARSQLRKAQVDPVLELASNASTAEINEARRRRSVRRGQDVYLPSWREAAVGLPNLFLRSALFSVCSAREVLVDETIATQGDTVITMTGVQLWNYDRRMFAACLNYYRDDRPLSSSAEHPWVKVSLWQLAQDLKVSYGANVHKAMRESLIRLNAAHLRIRVKRQDVPMPRLIDVAFDDGYLGRDTPAPLLRGSDTVAFRVLDSMANLFGPSDWSAISDTALHERSGLSSWLTGYYSTHAGPFKLAVAALHQYSGSICELREFRRRLKNALLALEGEDIPTDCRIASPEISLLL